jgi:peroxin-3
MQQSLQQSQFSELADIDASIISGATTLSVPTTAESVGSAADSDTMTSDSEVDVEHNPAASWATEFTSASDRIQRVDEDMLSSTLSQAISLPPTDTSSATPSPTSELSALNSSPPAAPILPPADPRTKKELWRDLKVQSTLMYHFQG